MFVLDLLREVLESMRNSYLDNLDRDRMELLKKYMRRAPSRPKQDAVLQGKPYNVNQFDIISAHLEGFCRLYDHLGDRQSRDLMCRVAALRLLGNTRVKLPLNTAEYWQERERVKSLACQEKKIWLQSLGQELLFFNLAEIGFPIELYALPTSIQTLFLSGQYEYRGTTPGIGADRGDVVIDAGGGWGETALYFAHLVGDSGKIYSFEFSPENLRITAENLNANPGLRSRIQLVEQALWDTSDESLSFTEGGFGSRIEEGLPDGEKVRVATVSIDDFVKRQSVDRVDFIKMDIEGAELKALLGARETLERFSPDLAISLYHNFTDFAEIPAFILSLGPRYRLYFGHYTIHPEESVLFATAGERQRTGALSPKV